MSCSGSSAVEAVDAVDAAEDVDAVDAAAVSEESVRRRRGIGHASEGPLRASHTFGMPATCREKAAIKGPRLPHNLSERERLNNSKPCQQQPADADRAYSCTYAWAGTCAYTQPIPIEL